MNWDKLLSTERLRTKATPQSGDLRNEFEIDFGRLIFSPAVRRMHDKTQVFPLTKDDHIHSRLTHSLEVMAIGFSFGLKIANDPELKNKFSNQDNLYRTIPVILQNCCLIHDVGNPPFGHFGEKVIQNYFKEFSGNEKNSSIWDSLNEHQKLDFTQFDGNAQGLRVLTKLLYLGDLYGVNLTCGSLSAFIKYPNTGSSNKQHIAQKKHGVFFSETEHFERIMQSTNLYSEQGYIRNPFSYIVEAADTICYRIMDLEDAFNKGLISFTKIYDEVYNLPALKKIIDNDPVFSEAGNSEKKKLVKLRVIVLQFLIDSAFGVFKANLSSIENGTFTKELLESDPLCNLLGKLVEEHVFVSREINSLEVTGMSVLKGLLDIYIDMILFRDKEYHSRAKSLISDSVINTVCDENEKKTIGDLSNYYKLKLIVDFISGMTDKYALNHFQILSGQKIV